MISKKIFIIYGGPSSEREVSFSSKDYFLKLYEDQNPILVEWLENFSFVLNKEVYKEEDFYTYLSKEKCIVIIAGHGEYIEDGYLQEKFALNKIPFTGSTASSCKLAMDKINSQRVAKKFVKTVPSYVSFPTKFSINDMQRKIGTDYPVFLKPNARGSSVGCYIVASRDDLLKTVTHLPNIQYLFQPFLEGVEVSIGSVRDGDHFFNISPTEIRPKLAYFFDWNSKYKLGGSEEITPCTLGKNFNRKVCDISNKIHNALELGYYSRTDFICDKKGELYYLETNAYPGMSKTSLVPQQLRYSCLEDEFKKGLIKWTVKKL